MAKDDAAGQAPVRHVTAIDGHRPRARVDAPFGHQPTPQIVRKGYQPVAQKPASQGGSQPTSAAAARIPPNPPNQGTSGKK